jgi:hypothetical protein
MSNATRQRATITVKTVSSLEIIMSFWNFRNPPSSSSNSTSPTAARGYALRLLDNSPAPLADDRPPQNQQPQQLPPLAPSSNYDDLIQQAILWKMEVEQLRDDIYFLQIQNSQSLDALCMAGADMPLDGDAGPGEHSAASE